MTVTPATYHFTLSLPLATICCINITCALYSEPRLFTASYAIYPVTIDFVLMDDTCIRYNFCALHEDDSAPSDAEFAISQRSNGCMTFSVQ